MKQLVKNALPYLGVIILFIVLSFAYFSPVIQGDELPQMDNIHAVGMAQELVKNEAATGEKSMWTNSMFGGMPAYQVKGDSSANLFRQINVISRLGLPFTTVAILFLYMIGFFVLLISLKVDKWLSIAGAIAFAFGSYNIIIIIAGHITKAYAIGMMAPVLAAILFAFNRNRIWGGILTAIALGMEIAYNHVQITYYLALLIAVLIIAKFIDAYKQKAIREFAKTAGVLVIAVVLALLPNLMNLLTTQEYGALTIRGKSELTNNSAVKQGSGLDKDYAFAWSYGLKETWTILIPNVVGGESKSIGESPELLSNSDSQLKEPLSQQSQYWGGRVFTSGPVYFGAIICFLFMLGAFIYKGPERWWLIAGTILSLFLAWGENFSFFNDFMFYHFPLYNKFRTVEMALVIAGLTMPLLAFLGLREIWEKPEVIKQNSLGLIVSFALTGGIALAFYLTPETFFNFISLQEMKGLAQQKLQSPQMADTIDLFIINLKQIRASLLKSDALRSFFFIVLASGSLWLYSTKKISSTILAAGLTLLIIIDLWSVDRRYLSNDDFVSPSQANSFVASVADKAILADKGLNNRVFAIYRNPFNEVNTSYFHQSIGGYHGAKLRRYQDVIDSNLTNNYQQLVAQLQKGSISGVDSILSISPALNMLNAKYVIYNPGQNPIVNHYALGNCWLVNSINWVENANDELASIEKTNLRQTANVDEQFKNIIHLPNTDVSGEISLVSYKPNHLSYEYNSPVEQLAVFSEIYYNKGWNAYVDGKLTPYARANYVLRAMNIPAGKHTIDFKFEPQTYKIGQIISYSGSILILILIGFLAFKYYRKKV